MLEQVEEVRHYATCRHPAFGRETWWLQAEHRYTTREHTMRGDQCTNFLRVYGPAHFVVEKYRECMDVWTDIARTNLGPDARVECIAPEVSECTHDGPRSTRFRYTYRVQVFLPQYHARADAPQCPQVGPIERRVRPAEYISCRHAMNGLAPDPAECLDDAEAGR